MPKFIAKRFYPNRIPAVSFRSFCSLAVIAASALAALAAAPAHADAAGQRLAEKVYNRPAGHDSSLHATMTLLDKGYTPRDRDMFVYHVDKGHGEKWSLVRFTSPPSIDGTGLLTQDHAGDESSQWVYLPALDRVRRISSSRKGGRFVGSDFYYEDLRDRPVNMDKHRIVGRGRVGPVICQELESVPTDPDNSVYSKRLSWIDPRTDIPLRVDFYEGGKQPSKRLVVNSVKSIQGYDTVVDSTMTDLGSGHQTRVLVHTIVYDRHLPDTLFSRRALSDPQFESHYRP